MKLIALLLILLPQPGFAQDTPCYRVVRETAMHDEVDKKYTIKYTAAQKDSLRLLQLNDYDRYTHVYQTNEVNIDYRTWADTLYYKNNSITRHIVLTPLRDAEKIYITARHVRDNGYLTNGCQLAPLFKAYKLTFADGSIIYVTEPFYTAYWVHEMFLLVDGSVIAHDDDVLQTRHKTFKKREKAVSGLLAKMLKTPLRSIGYAYFHDKAAYLKNAPKAYTEENVWLLDAAAADQLMLQMQCLSQAGFN